MSYRWFQVHLVLPIQPVLRLKWARPAAAVLTLLLVVPVAAIYFVLCWPLSMLSRRLEQHFGTVSR